MASSTNDDVTTVLRQILHNQQTFETNLTTLSNELTTLRTRLAPPGFNALGSNIPTPTFHPSSIKLELPRFDGSDPLGWIFKIKQFFEFHNIPEDQRLRLASFYMEGEALTWYQWMHSNNQLLSWPMFLHALELRFAPSHYDDPKGALFKLCQTTSVKDYQTAFENLANRITGLPSEFYLSCFISGLKPEIRRELQAFQPLLIAQAISLAKLQEEKLNDKSSSFYTKPGNTNSNSTIPPRSSFRPTVTASPQKTPTTPKPFPIKRLSLAELQARREQNLCYNCDEKYVFGHKCKRQFHLLIAEPDPTDPTPDLLTQLLPEPVTTPPEPNVPEDPAQISLHALMGHTIPQTLRVLGHIAKTPVQVLIDSGSTHNFIHDRVAKQLGLPLHQAQAFNVLVGNGAALDCSYICPQTLLSLDSHDFIVDLFVLPLSGADLVLGVQWLRSLGPVLTDYEALTLKFVRGDKIVQISAGSKPIPEAASLHQLRRLASTDALDTVCQFQLLSPQTTEPQHHPDIQQLLSKFTHIFSEPNTLPPARTINHHIPLLEGANPVNVRPYCYPQFQKQEIEKTDSRDVASRGHSAQL